MSLEKDLQQEDYLQGRMQGNPYSSKEPGLGPLMRDVKNKICIGKSHLFITMLTELISLKVIVIARYRVQ